MHQGYLRELNHQIDVPISYDLSFDNAQINLNETLGNQIKIHFTGNKSCITCGRSVRKLFSNGYCYPCFTSLAECDLCIVKPHQCHFHQGTCRDHSFAESHCMIPHYIYLAFSSGYKVGITRKGREFKRWVDQGATFAMLLAEVPTRKRAGEMEMEIAKYLADKTDWRKMLRGDIQPSFSFEELKLKVLANLNEAFIPYLIPNKSNVYEFLYPRKEDFVPNLKSFSMDKEPSIEGRLMAIKGQYILLDTGVFNVKKHAGFEITYQSH